MSSGCMFVLRPRLNPWLDFKASGETLEYGDEGADRPGSTFATCSPSPRTRHGDLALFGIGRCSLARKDVRRGARGGSGPPNSSLNRL